MPSLWWYKTNKKTNSFGVYLEISEVFLFWTCLYGSISLFLSLCISLALSLSLPPSIHPSIYSIIHPSSIQYIHPLINLSIPFVETVWIGGTDSTKEGSWTWTEPTDAMSFTDWGPNQPNNNYNNQDCLSLYMQYDFMWADENCLTTYKYICEKNLQWNDLFNNGMQQL